MTQRQVEIKRYEVIQTISMGYDQYGNLLVAAIGGNGNEGVFKVGEKRAKNLEPAFIPGRATKIGWAFFNKEYIATAELYQGETATGEPQPPAVPIPQATRAKSSPPNDKSGSKYKADPDKTASIERQVALKAAVDYAIAIINAGKVPSANEIVNSAEQFASFIANDD